VFAEEERGNAFRTLLAVGVSVNSPNTSPLSHEIRILIAAFDGGNVIPSRDRLAKNSLGSSDEQERDSSASCPYERGQVEVVWAAVADSDANYDFQETVNKTKAMLKAIALAETFR